MTSKISAAQSSEEMYECHQYISKAGVHGSKVGVRPLFKMLRPLVQCGDTSSPPAANALKI